MPNENENAGKPAQEPRNAPVKPGLVPKCGGCGRPFTSCGCTDNTLRK